MDRGARAGGVTDTWVLCEVRAVRLRSRARPRFVWLAASSRGLEFLEIRLYQMLCTNLRCAVLSCAVMEEGSFFSTPVRCESSHRKDPSYLG